jgi:hypothetical protein
MKDSRREFMTDEQINTTQIAMVVDFFLKCNSMYEPVVENRVYRKRSENAAVIQKDVALAVHDAARAEQDSARTARDVANNAKGALLRPTSWRITALLRSLGLWE